MRIGSLFTGIEGLDLAVRATFGGSVTWCCEAPRLPNPKTDKERREAKRRAHVLERLETRYPDMPIVHGVERAAECGEEVDVLCGGFPCIDTSQAGRREGLAGEHSGLWYDMAAAVRTLSPPVVVIENVRGLVARGIELVLGDLADAGYDAEWGVLGACCVGAPHIRERVFILAWKGEPPEFGGGLDLGNPGWADGSWWTDPVVDEFPGRRERLAALGNSCSPQQARRALGILLDRAGDPMFPILCRDDLLFRGSRKGWTGSWEKWPCSGALRGGWLGLRSEIRHMDQECVRDSGALHLAQLPTPSATDYGSSGNGEGNNVASRGRPSLETAARLGTLPTPTVGDARAAGSRNLEGSDANAGVSLTDAVCRGGSDVGGTGTPKLSPVFVERMMGFPDGWSAVR